MRLFVLQGRVIWALVLREMQTRYGRENLGFLWIIGEPILFTAGVTIVWSLIRPSYEHGIPVTAFVVTGYTPLTMWRHCVARSVKAFESNGSLLFHRQVSPLDIILSRVLLEVMGSILAGLIVAAFAIALGFMEPPKDLALIYMGLAYHVSFCLGSALLFAAGSERSEIIEKITNIFSYLMIPASGSFSMVSWIPEQYQWILLLSPSVHGLEMIRAGQFGPGVHAIWDLSYVTSVNALMILIGLSLVLRSRRFIVVQ